MLTFEPWMRTAPQDDIVFTGVIAPWLARQHAEMKALDQERGPDIHYVFADHVARVAAMGRDVALHMDAPDSAAQWYHAALMVHDCGKTVLPPTIWDSEGKPDEAMKAQRRSHAPLGAQMIEADLPPGHPFTSFAADIARHHHEQMNGKGFLGVNAGDLSAWVRLACIVDSYDGMAVWRPHYGDRDTSPEAVYERLSIEKGPAMFDPELLIKFGDFLHR